MAKRTEVHLGPISNDNGNVRISTLGTKAAPGSKLVSYSINWGDGTPNNNGTKPPIELIHEYKKSGNYTIILNVRDNKNRIAEDTMGMIVSISASPAPSIITVSADVDQVILLPATEITLFGNASKSGVTSPHDFAYLWEQVSGPTTCTFSAWWDRHTTVRGLTVAGNYIFKLNAINGPDSGNDTVTVSVVAEINCSRFYVDPSYTGGLNDGSAARPWTSLSMDVPDSKWNTINTALNTNHVIIFYSARQAGSDTPEVETLPLNIWRTNTTTNVLMIDGKSKYNTNDTLGNWIDYSGSNKFNLTIASGGGCSIGVQSNQLPYPMNYTRLRGFDCSGASGRVLLIGSFLTVEDFNVHNVSQTGANFQFQRACNADASVHFGNKDHITFRRISISGGPSIGGEGIYVAGTYSKPDSDGHPAYGNNHNKLLIEDCNVDMSGTQIPLGEGDGIDIKAGVYDVTIRECSIQNNTASAIETLGVFWPTGRGVVRIGNYLIENNYIKSGGGISLQKMDGCVVRNNKGIGININTSGEDYNPSDPWQTTPDYWINYDVRIYNNIQKDACIVIFYADVVNIKNNALIDSTGPDNSSLKGNSTATNVFEDYNATDRGAQQMVSGGNSLTLISPYAGVFVNIPGEDFHLGPSSILRQAADPLITIEVPIDFDGDQRLIPADIGVYNRT